MNSTNLTINTQVLEMNNPAGYTIGAVIALFILVYLVYSLVKPEHF